MNAIPFLGNSLLITGLLLVPGIVVGAICLVPPLRRRLHIRPRRSALIAGIVVGVLCFGAVSYVWALGQAVFEFDAFFTNYYYKDRPTSDNTVHRTVSNLTGELWFRHVLPPSVAKPCYTDGELCAYIDTNQRPGGADPYTWEQYGGKLAAAFCVGLFCYWIVNAVARSYSPRAGSA